MQNEQEFFSHSGNVDGGYDLSFPTPTNVDLFSFPMPGPATAPAYMNGKLFWDPSNGMTDMTMNFSGDPFGTNGADWTGDLLPQHQINTAVVHQSNALSSRRQRPLLAKPQTPSMPPLQSGLTFDFGMAAISEDSFTIPSPSSAINPNNMFSFSNMTSPTASNATFNTSAIQTNSHIEIQPQPTLLSPLAIPRSTSAQSRRPDSSHMRRPITPLKNSKSGAYGTKSHSLDRPPAPKPAASLTKDAQPPANFAGKGRYSSGTGNAGGSDGLSLTKQHSLANLQAIPEKEKLLSPRTAITFSIDANGRARTETVILDPSIESRPRSSNFRISAYDALPQSESSTDEEVIVIAGRNSSLAQKDKNRPSNMPKMARFNTSIKHYPRLKTSERKLSTGNVKAMPRAALALNDDDEEEEVVPAARQTSGDASTALRRVMENRRRSVSGITSMPPSTNTQTICIQSSYGATTGRDRDRHYKRPSCGSSSNMAYSASSSTVTDLDHDVEMCDTPSTIAGGNERTRCICQRRKRDGDEFMIQCESCEHWQHSTCVKIDPRELPKVYICAFCAQTPNMRAAGRRSRDKEREITETVLSDKRSPLHTKPHSWRVGA